SHFDEIKVCVGYEINGKKLKTYPTSLGEMMKVTPVYETLKGWNSEISNITSYDLLPAEAKDYLQFISQQSGFEISIISVGPRRDQTIQL
ncbi:MAG: adenylosuccinate synthetase, partial [Ignavibacteria bacterium]|nr:adenylosuccinate synthetase [Ignavibacteria bacterium]